VVAFWTLLPALYLFSISSVANWVDRNGRIWLVVPGMGITFRRFSALTPDRTHFLIRIRSGQTVTSASSTVHKAPLDFSRSAIEIAVLTVGNAHAQSS
jgi:hypothetical protein